MLSSSSSISSLSAPSSPILIGSHKLSRYPSNRWGMAPTRQSCSSFIAKLSPRKLTSIHSDTSMEYFQCRGDDFEDFKWPPLSEQSSYRNLRVNTSFKDLYSQSPKTRDSGFSYSSVSDCPMTPSLSSGTSLSSVPNTPETTSHFSALPEPDPVTLAKLEGKLHSIQITDHEEFEFSPASIPPEYIRSAVGPLRTTRKEAARDPFGREVYANKALPVPKKPSKRIVHTRDSMELSYMHTVSPTYSPRLGSLPEASESWDSVVDPYFQMHSPKTSRRRPKHTGQCVACGICQAFQHRPMDLGIELENEVYTFREREYEFI